MRRSFKYFIKNSEINTTTAPIINTTSYPIFTHKTPPKNGIITAAI
ncbi:MAG: hypothetical protein NUV32_05740 [Exilispira sp.]|nr:hypothetical protein [Exilispira sp.]